MTDLAPDPRRLFPRAPMGPPTLGPSCRPLAYTRVYSLDTLEGREGSLLVLARHRLGAALSRMVSRVGDGSDCSDDSDSSDSLCISIRERRRP